MFHKNYFAKAFFSGYYFPPIEGELPIVGWQIYKRFNLMISRIFEVNLER